MPSHIIPTTISKKYIAPRQYQLFTFDNFQALLEAKAFVNSKTKSGWTPLHFAAKNGHEGVVNYLVRKKAAVVDSMTMKKQTPLHLAATNGKLQVYSVIIIKDCKALHKDSIFCLHALPLFKAALALARSLLRICFVLLLLSLLLSAIVRKIAPNPQ